MLRPAFIGFLLALVAALPLRAQDEPDLYRLEVGDQIAISVLEDPSLNTTVLVRPDGRVTMPLAGTILVEGRTPEAVEATIRRALSSDFLAPPTVTVSLVGLGGGGTEQRIYVLGEVAAPGVYPVELPLDVLQMLALAGGPSPFAAVERIQVRRQANGAQQVLLFNYEAVTEAELPLNLIQLRDGDVIVVPERGLFE